MKANVFEETLPTGDVRVWSPQYSIEVFGFDLQDACQKFIAELQVKCPWAKITITAAEETPNSKEDDARID